MAYWVLKTEPEVYSWEMLERDGTTDWTGVRNFAARNNLRLMKPGDTVFIYHTGNDKMIMGLATIASEPHDDPTDEKWAAIKVKALKPLVRVVSLDEVRNTHGLSVMPLVALPRLSVQPVTDAQAEMILKIAKTSM
ncbi:MAG: EVE domain-containing protein [Patescibacteria group bacterium]